MSQPFSARTYARVAGVLILLSFVAGGFGEAYVPMRLIVPGDAGATARNILSSESLFRWGFVGYLVEALCDVSLTWALYVLLRPVHRDLALLAVFFRLIGTAGFAMGQVLHLSVLLLLHRGGYAAAFSPDQLDALVLLLLRVGLRTGEVFSMFYGAGSLVFGVLMFRSGFLPRILGVLLAISGLVFLTSIFVTVLTSARAAAFVFLPVALTALSMAVWFLVKGVDVPKWEAAAARTDAKVSA